VPGPATGSRRGLPRRRDKGGAPVVAGDDLLLTRAEAAECMHISVQTVRRLAESGHLAEVQVSVRAVRVRAASVDRLVREGLPRRRWVREYRPLLPTLRVLPDTLLRPGCSRR
jgi:excisionase family DNA binding protein